MHQGMSNCQCQWSYQRELTRRRWSWSSFSLAHLAHEYDNITEWHIYDWLRMQHTWHAHNTDILWSAMQWGARWAPSCTICEGTLHTLLGAKPEININLTQTTLTHGWCHYRQTTLYDIVPWLLHHVGVVQALLSSPRSSPLGPSPWRQQTITNTYTTNIHAFT